MDYRREIDGLRALAVLSVVFYHAGFKLFSGGFVGVDVFFVISGYLIASLILREQATGRFSLTTFYERRARRILPALLLVVSASVVPAFVLLHPGDFQSFARSVVSTLLIYSNIHFRRESGYFDTSAETKPLLHTWSLSVEEQFYVIFPIVFLLIVRYTRHLAVPALLAAFCASLLYAQLGGLLEPGDASAADLSAPPSGNFYLLPSRIWELLLGSLVAVRLHGGAAAAQTPEAAISQAGSFAGLALIAASVLVFDHSTPWPSIYSLAPTVGAALFILYCRKGAFAYRLCSGKVLVGIGLISYSLYLWHQPVFAFARIGAGISDPWAFVPVIAFVVGLSAVSWRFVEQPFRSPKRIGSRRFLAFAFSACAALVVVGRAGVLTDGFVALRMNPAQLGVRASASPSPKRTECHAPGSISQNPAEACAYFGPNVRWAVFGDSHAVELAYSMAQALQDRDKSAGLKHLSFSNCAPAFSRTDKKDPCGAWTEKAAQFLADDPDIQTIVVSYAIVSHIAGWTRQRIVPTAGERDQIWRSYVDVLSYFASRGKRVVAVLQAPEIEGHVQHLLYSTGHPERIAGVSRDVWDVRKHVISRKLAELPKDVIVVDPTELFCDVKACLAVRGGASLYYDDNHMSIAGARIVAEEIFRRLDKK